MRNYTKHIILTLSMAIILSCGQSDNLDVMEKSFPSSGAPVGSDLISSTTNMSGKEDETSPKLSAYAGAAFVQAPQINNYGAVSLSYAIETTPGRAGREPGIGLSYSSSSGDGLVGIGWSLGTGLGVISRTSRHGQLYYDHRDTFTYNGKRLIKVEGPSNSENGLYRLEIESDFSKIILEDAESGGTWRVIDKTGTITIFGSGLSSRIYRPDDQTKTFIWNFEKSIDLNGNYMTAEFDTSQYDKKHVLYLKEIRYTGNEDTGLEANQYVRFHYKDRDDSYVSKAPGFIMEMDKLLDYIEVGWDDPNGFFGKNTELWRYTMIYENSKDSNRPLLKTVDSTRNTTKPEFIYQPAKHKFQWKKIENPDFNDPEINPEATKYFEGDFNGDGLSDMVFFNPETGNWKAAEAKRNGGYSYKTYGNRLRGYDNPSKIQWFKGNVTGDYNGDGRSDIAYFLPERGEFWVAEHNGKVFNFRSYGRQNIVGLDIMKCEWFPGDYDGNGLSDALLFNEPTGEWILMTNEGGRFEFVKFSHRFQNLFRNDYQPDANYSSESTNDKSDFGKDRDKIIFLNGDYNGDGRSDISLYDKRSGKWIVGENYRDDRLGFRLEWKLYKIFTAPEEVLFGQDRFSGDFNGDGFSDFLFFNKESLEWIIGETGDGTIHFRVFGKMPINKDITRWLQGDFNGDGRTDIGFYSKTDNNFWVGEAAPHGFRYRIYNNLKYGPDPDEVLRTPYPEDEVKIGDGTGIAVQNGKTVVSNYQHDVNYHTGRGERIFTGNFSNQADDKPELLVYKKKENNFYYKVGTSPISGSPVLSGIDLENENVQLLNRGIAMPFKNYKDAVIYYIKERDYSSVEYRFYAIYHNGHSFENYNFATINQDDVDSFNPEENLFVIGEFDDNAGSEHRLMVFDYHGNTPGFVIYDDTYSDGKGYIDIDNYGDINSDYFKKIKHDPSKIKIFSGKFTTNNETESAEILLVDMSAQVHKWYLGFIDYTNKKITFTSLYGNVNFTSQGYDGQYKVIQGANDGNFIYSRLLNNSPVFYKIQVDGDSIREVEIYKPTGKLTFKNEYDHENNPIVHSSDGVKKVQLISGRPSLTDILPGQFVRKIKIERPDLKKQVYAFRWIQGDYNGDGKSDIGIFHLKERYWYFALTQGTVPDMIYKVYNGIGGTYKMDYVNSSSFDNTGEDDIPDLPMNYKVCSMLTVDDGNGHAYYTYYKYKDGYAFSDFINGYKESDYFGFGYFEVIDALGNRSIKKYYNVPYDDFRKNRALAGAIRQSKVVGNDGVEYSRTEYEYKLHKIAKSDELSVMSFFVEPIEVRKHLRGTLIQTTRSNILLTPGKYEMISKSESITDHFQDDVHFPVTFTSHSEFENINSTNEMRFKFKKTFDETSHEITTFFEYDSKGNIASEILKYTGSGLQSASDRIMQYDYDDYGNRIRETNASGSPTRVVEKTYDSLLHQFVVQDKSHGDNIELINNYEINYAIGFGEVDKKTDPNGNCSHYEFDQFGRLKKQFTDANERKELLASYTYNTNFPLSSKVTQFTGNGKKIETRIFSDGIGREIHSIRSAKNVPGKRYIKSGMLIYDLAGRMIRKSQTHWADDDEIDHFKRHTSEKHPTITEYDGIGRVIKVTLPEGYRGEKETSISFTYNDPWEIVETHSVGRSKRTIKNAMGKVLYVEDFGIGDDGQGLSAKIGFAYDLAGRKIKKMDLNSTSMTLEIPETLFQLGVKDNSGNNISIWKYDGMGQLIESSDPDLGYSQAVYNEFGEVIESLDANNKLTTMEYDRLGRRIVKHLPDNDGDIEYIYDSYQGSANALGRIVHINDLAQSKTFSYDMMGRIEREVRIIHANNNEEYITDYEFDLLSRKKIITYPNDPNTLSRMKVTYEHNAMGVTGIRTEISGMSKGIITDVEYNEFGQIIKVARGNMTETEYVYDIKGRLERLITTSMATGSIKKIQDTTYEFKVDNSIRSVLNTPDIDTDGNVNSHVRYEYTYDGLNRLIKALGDYQKIDDVSNPDNGDGATAVHKQFERSYSYATNGNIKGKTIYDPVTHIVSDAWNYSYEGKNHAVTGITTLKHGAERFEMQYDDAGNMVFQRDNFNNLAKSVEYDSSNRIKKVFDPDTGDLKGEYEYDNQGFRVRKFATKLDDEGKGYMEILYPSMYFGVERNFQKYMDKEKENDKDKIESVAAINNIYLNGVRIAAVSNDNSVRFYLTDQVDSVKAVVDDKGKVVTRMEYLPYGETWWQEGNSNNKAKYNSQEFDEETNFYYYNARFYDPIISRFVTADTVIDGEHSAKGWNRYMYVGGNPIIYRDPTGHEQEGVGITYDDGTTEVATPGKNTLTFPDDTITVNNTDPKVVNQFKRNLNRTSNARGAYTNDDGRGLPVREEDLWVGIPGIYMVNSGRKILERTPEQKAEIASVSAMMGPGGFIGSTAVIANKCYAAANGTSTSREEDINVMGIWASTGEVAMGLVSRNPRPTREVTKQKNQVVQRPSNNVNRSEASRGRREAIRQSHPGRMQALRQKKAESAARDAKLIKEVDKIVEDVRRTIEASDNRLKK